METYGKLILFVVFFFINKQRSLYFLTDLKMKEGFSFLPYAFFLFAYLLLFIKCSIDLAKFFLFYRWRLVTKYLMTSFNYS